MSDKIIGVVVFYNPKCEHYKYLECNSKVLDHVIVVVNGPNLNAIENLDLENITVLYEGSNLGIAKATNDGIEIAIERGSEDYVVLLDQDTLLPTNYKEILLTRERIESLGIGVGIIAPIYKNPRTQTVSLSLIFHKFRFKRGRPVGAFYESTCPIASGSLLRLKVFRDVGMLDEKLFIDYVDTEYALRLSSHGYKNYLVPSICMSHELGEQEIHKIGKILFRPTNHSFVRKYYITRNRLYVMFKYGFKYPSLIYFEFLAISLDVFRVILFERDRLRKLKAIAYGLKDFLLGRYGAVNFKNF